VHGVRAYFVGKHNFGLKNFAPLKIFQKKKRKKKVLRPCGRKMRCNIFLSKSIAVFYFTEIVFAKNHLGLDIVGAFS
jgi:hypothetical protein